MDHIHHLSNWGARPMPEKIAMCKAITDQDAWIFEGGLSKTYPERLRRADTMIWIDIPMWLRFGVCCAGRSNIGAPIALICPKVALSGLIAKPLISGNGFGTRGTVRAKKLQG
ncbi:MAG: hypothetical protein ABF248_10290 [Yoonia sp.]